MTRRTQAQWQTIIEQHVQSRLSPREYCSQHNIRLQTFYSLKQPRAQTRVRYFTRLLRPQRQKG